VVVLRLASDSCPNQPQNGYVTELALRAFKSEGYVRSPRSYYSSILGARVVMLICIWHDHRVKRGLQSKFMTLRAEYCTVHCTYKVRSPSAYKRDRAYLPSNFIAETAERIFM